MEMFLMALCMSLLGVAATAIAFAAATKGEPAPPEPAADRKPIQLPVPGFFLDSPDVRVPQPRVPIEALLLQIERHIRLEQAAAESFLVSPTAASLHSRTSSPLVH